MENIVIREPRHIYEFYEDYLNGITHGVINLAVPILNINEYSGGHPNMLALVLEKTSKTIDTVLNYDGFVVTDPKGSELKKGAIIPRNEFRINNRDFDVQALTGAEALIWLLSTVDFKKEQSAEGNNEKFCLQQLDEIELNGKPSINDEKLTKRFLELSLDWSRSRIDALLYVQKYYDRLFIREINLFPEHIRVILNEEAKNSPYSVKLHLRYLYQRVATRNCRLERLLTLKSPDILITEEKRGLQKSVDDLLGNGKTNPGQPWDPKDEKIDRRFSYASLSDVVLRNTRLW